MQWLPLCLLVHFCSLLPASQHSEEAKRFAANTKDIMDLFLLRNNHLFNRVPAQELNFLYDDEDSQGSYLSISEEGSSISSGSGSGIDDSFSGSGSGEIPTLSTLTRLVIKKFQPEVCEKPRKTATPRSPTPTTQRVTDRAQGNTGTPKNSVTAQQSTDKKSTPPPVLTGEVTEDMPHGTHTTRGTRATTSPRVDSHETTNSNVNLQEHQGSSASSLHSSSILLLLLVLLATCLHLVWPQTLALPLCPTPWLDSDATRPFPVFYRTTTVQEHLDVSIETKRSMKPIFWMKLMTLSTLYLLKCSN